MAAHTLDELLGELGSAVAAADARLQEDRRARWRRGFGLDGDGPLEFQVPSLGEDGWRVLQVPLESLMCRDGMSVAGLSLEIDCALRVRPPSTRDGAVRIELDPCARRTPHRLALRLQGPEVEVWLDGTVLRRNQRDGGVAGTSPAPRKAWRIRRRSRPSLLLEGEDARRALAALGPVLAREASARRRRLVLLLSLSALLAAVAAVLPYLLAS